MNPENIKNSIQAVVDGLAPLAQQLQVPIEGLWDLAIRYNYAQAISGLVVNLLAIVCIILIRKSMLKKYTEKDLHWRDDEFHIIINAISGFVLGIALIILIFTAHEFVMRLIAPEMMTAKDIFDLVEGNNY